MPPSRPNGIGPAERDRMICPFLDPVIPRKQPRGLATSNRAQKVPAHDQIEAPHPGDDYCFFNEQATAATGLDGVGAVPC